jgi:anaerobic C4-dicarboxylate transporter-like protein
MMFWVQFAIVLLCILIGSRKGPMGLGTFSAIGLVIMAFVFGAQPTSPPIDVMLMILAVVTASAALEAARGLDYLVEIAERLLRAKPKLITFVAPAVTYAFTFAAGTGHTAYATLPVIAEVARSAGVRPERPMSVSVIASQLAIVACPISAAVVTLLALLAGADVHLGDILIVTIPSTIAGVVIAAMVMSRYGKPLAEDPIYQGRLANGEIKDLEAREPLAGVDLRRAQIAVTIFLLAALGVVTLGLVPGLRPTFLVDGEPILLGMPHTIQILMLSAAALILWLCDASSNDAIKGGVMRAGVGAVIAIFGIAWLGNTFFEFNRAFVVDHLEDVIEQAPWLFAFGLFAMSILIFSQAGTTAALMPVGIALGIEPASLIAMFPAVCGFFFLPAYGTSLAAIAFDQSGTTRIGRFVLNHSFMVPGLVAVSTAVVVGLLVSGIVL